MLANIISAPTEFAPNVLAIVTALKRGRHTILRPLLGPAQLDGWQDA
jgi:hypothetical protein